MHGLDRWIGTHEGTWKTWLMPGELHDRSALSATVERTERGWLIRYNGSIADDDVTGSMLVAEDGRSIDWTDSWHTGGASERLESSDGEPPSYLYGPDDEQWRWSIVIEPADSELAVRHFNAPPGADGALAVEMLFGR